MSRKQSPSPTRHAPRHPDLGITDALVQTSFAVQAILGEIAAEHDLSTIQARLLGVLRDRELRMAQLARLLGLTKSSMTGLVDRAERRGLVRRVTIPVGDERAVHVVLSDEGQVLAQRLGSEVARQVATLVDHLAQTNQDRLSRLLTEVVLQDADLHGVDLTTGQLAQTRSLV